MLSPLSRILYREQTRQFKLIKDSPTNRVNDLSINKAIAVTLYDHLLIFLDTDKKFELQGDFLDIITTKNYKVDHGNLSDEKIMYEIAKQMYFDEKALGIEITRDKPLIIFFQSPAIMTTGISTKLAPKNPKELCVRLKSLLLEKQDRNNSHITNEKLLL